MHFYTYKSLGEFIKYGNYGNLKLQNVQPGTFLESNQEEIIKEFKKRKEVFFFGDRENESIFKAKRIK